jgi:hypothetical protein
MEAALHLEPIMRPWYRSRLIWLGTPGLLFLLWISLGDPYRYCHLRVRFGDYGVGFTDRLRHAHLRLDIPKKGPMAPFAVEFTKPRIVRAGDDPGLFPRAIGRTTGWYSRLHRSEGVLSVAYWFLVPVYVAVWTGLFLAWQRRKARFQRGDASSLEILRAGV